MTRTSTQQQKSTASAWRAVVSGGAFVLLLAVLAVAIAVAVVPRAMNGAPLTVLSGSMEPTYSPGDMVISVPRDSYAIGDVVTFQPVSGDPTLVTHRITGVRQGPDGITYVTQGDANGAPDDPIVANQVMGKVIYHVPYIGHVANVMGQDRQTLIIIAGGGLLGYGIYAVGSSMMARRSKNDRNAAASALQTQGD
ncbi:signal peptidase I [Nesterenkonia muleiensis]|uniref:signal peptidase I n=1 Tax=Nesterenkonia muleiensis TaxID=2282648 RepID=UPI000E766B1C|nr:signal peptidase I [Nesterenkonia muleiensis]